jgi:hypothetical protein
MNHTRWFLGLLLYIGALSVFLMCVWLVDVYVLRHQGVIH